MGRAALCVACDEKAMNVEDKVDGRISAACRVTVCARRLYTRPSHEFVSLANGCAENEPRRIQVKFRRR